MPTEIFSPFVSFKLGPSGVKKNLKTFQYEIRQSNQRIK